MDQQYLNKEPLQKLLPRIEMRFFNTAGPVDPKRHYYVPHRLNEKEVYQLIEQQKYFVLHAPRQSGKTTAIYLFVDQINKEDKYKALYINVEPAQIARGSVKDGMEIILRELRGAAKIALVNNNQLFDYIQDALKNISGNSLKEVLQSWSMSSNKPIIIFIDEIDSLIGDTLISVLRQLRAGYINRPDAFPQSVCLIGVRDVRDYRIWSNEADNFILGGSAFNIKAESLTLSNFSLNQIRMLYQQHTQETGQQFTQEAIEYVYYLTQGQPWLVNALAYQACFKDVTDRTQTITKEIIEHAKNSLLSDSTAHFFQLTQRLKEPRIQIIIDSIINNKFAVISSNDLWYARDIGIVKTNGFEITNPMYLEVIDCVYSNQDKL